METNSESSDQDNNVSPANMNNYFEDTTRADSSAISKFFRNMMEEQERENAIEKGVQVAAQRVRQVAQNTEQESRLAFELVNAKRQKFIQEKMRQQIRENNEELRELEIKLRAAYTGKALAAQIAEREAIRQQEKLLMEQENELLEAARVKDAEYLQLQRQNHRDRKKHFREEMIEQMAERASERAKRYEEFLREKKILDEISRKIVEEEMAELRAKEAKQAKFKHDIQEFLCMQKAWAAEHKLQTDTEDQKLEEMLKQRERELIAKEEEKRRLKEQREMISEKIGQYTHSLAEEKLKHQELLENLHVAEYAQKSEENLRTKLERQLRDRFQTRLALEQQKAENIQRRVQEQEEFRLFREEQMRLLAERDKLELLSNDKRRRKEMDHRREIQACLDEKKKRRAEEVAILVKYHSENIENERQRQRLVEEERIRMLKEHAHQLMGYLPPGILKESDREFLSLPPKN